MTFQPFDPWPAPVAEPAPEPRWRVPLVLGAIAVTEGIGIAQAFELLTGGSERPALPLSIHTVKITESGR